MVVEVVVVDVVVVEVVVVGVVPELKNGIISLLANTYVVVLLYGLCILSGGKQWRELVGLEVLNSKPCAYGFISSVCCSEMVTSSF